MLVNAGEKEREKDREREREKERRRKGERERERERDGHREVWKQLSSRWEMGVSPTKGHGSRSDRMPQTLKETDKPALPTPDQTPPALPQTPGHDVTWQLRTHTRTDIHTHMNTGTRADTHTHTHTHTHLQAHTHPHIHIHFVHMHKHTHMYSLTHNTKFILTHIQCTHIQI